MKNKKENISQVESLEDITKEIQEKELIKQLRALPPEDFLRIYNEVRRNFDLVENYNINGIDIPQNNPQEVGKNIEFHRKIINEKISQNNFFEDERKEIKNEKVEKISPTFDGVYEEVLKNFIDSQEELEQFRAKNNYLLKNLPSIEKEMFKLYILNKEELISQIRDLNLKLPKKISKSNLLKVLISHKLEVELDKKMLEFKDKSTRELYNFLKESEKDNKYSLRVFLESEIKKNSNLFEDLAKKHNSLSYDWSAIYGRYYDSRKHNDSDISNLSLQAIKNDDLVIKNIKKETLLKKIRQEFLLSITGKRVKHISDKNWVSTYMNKFIKNVRTIYSKYPEVIEIIESR